MRIFLMVTRAGRLRRSLRRPMANGTSVTPKAKRPAKLSVTINQPELPLVLLGHFRPEIPSRGSC